MSSNCERDTDWDVRFYRENRTNSYIIEGWCDITEHDETFFANSKSMV